MVGEDTVRKSIKQLKRVHVIRQVLAKAVRQREAPSPAADPAGSGGGRRGARASESRPPLQSATRPSPEGARAAAAVRESLWRFWPTLAAEKSAERSEVTLSVETLRGWLRQQGIEHFYPAQVPASGVAARKAQGVPCCRWRARTMRGSRTAAQPVSW